MEAIRSKNLISAWFACPTAGPPTNRPRGFATSMGSRLYLVGGVRTWQMAYVRTLA